MLRTIELILMLLLLVAAACSFYLIYYHRSYLIKRLQAGLISVFILSMLVFTLTYTFLTILLPVYYFSVDPNHVARLKPEYWLVGLLIIQFMATLSVFIIACLIHTGRLDLYICLNRSAQKGER